MAIVADRERILLITQPETDNGLYDILVAIGLEVFRKEIPDNVFDVFQQADILIVDIPGNEALTIQYVTKFREALPSRFIPVLFCADNNLDFIQHVLEAGANDFLLTPFDEFSVKARVLKQSFLLKREKELLYPKYKMMEMTAKDKIYSVIAHDMRSPISSLKMLLNLLASRLESETVSSDVYEIVNMSNELVEESFSLLDNLLKWAKNVSGRLEAVFQYIDLVSLTKDAIAIFRNIAKSKDITINLSSVEKAEVYVDINMIKTCIRNLISNALKFSPNGSVINILIEETDTCFVFCVEDFGSGMKADFQAKLRKQILDYNSISDIKLMTGSGLGLLLTQNFILKNRGEFWFDSKERIGSSFYFSLIKV